MTDKTNKTGWLIITAFAVFIIGFNLIPAGQYSARSRDLIAGVYVLGIGAAFLSAYFFENESTLFRGLMWLCKNFSFPSGRKMALFYAGLCAVLGSIAMLSGFGVIDFSRHG